MSDESVLLKIHRQFKQEEGFAFLFGFIKHLKFKIGEQKSEIEELKHNSREYLRDQDLKAQYKELNQKHERTVRDLKHYQNLYYAEKIKNENRKV